MRRIAGGAIIGEESIQMIEETRHSNSSIKIVYRLKNQRLVDDDEIG